jgi:hypothetical protein
MFKCVRDERARGRKRRHEPIPCPNPLHAGSHVKAKGTRRTKSGLRRDYLCTPVGGRPHKFAVMIEPGEEPAPVFQTPPSCPVHGTASRRTRWGTYRSADGSTHRQRYRCEPFELDPDYPRGSHTFTPTLPRSHIDEGARCTACEQRRSVHSGGQAVSRGHSWPLRIVAEALEKLASGAESYGSVSVWAWRAIGRRRTRPAKLSDGERERRAKVKEWERACRKAEAEGSRKPRKPRGLSLEPLPSDRPERRRRVDANGEELPPRRISERSAEAHRRWHTAADWVEMFAPVLWQPLHERLLEEERKEHSRRSKMSADERGADGRPQALLLDDIPFQTKGVFEGASTPRMTRDYFVLGAATIVWPDRAPGKPAPVLDDRYTHLRLVRAYPTNEAAAWQLLFQELGYEPGVCEPEFILADAGAGLRRGVAGFFRQAVFVPSLFHIHRALALALESQTPGAAVITDAGPALHPDIAAHLGWLTARRLRSITKAQWSAWWDDFETLLERLGLAPEKIQERRSTYQEPVERALPALRRNPGVPMSTGGFENVLHRRVQAVLTGRAHGFANIERTNNLFDLVVCRDRGVFDNRPEVIEALRSEALRYEGWSAEPRTVADPQPPPGSGRYSSLRDRDLLLQLTRARGIAA